MDHTGIPNKTTTRHLKVMTRSHKEKDYVNEEKYKAYVMRAYLILLFGTTIFSNKAKNYVDLTNLAYFRYLDQVATLFLGHCCIGIHISGVVKCHNPLRQICGWLHETASGNIDLI
jgi:hypothetical protein